MSILSWLSGADQRRVAESRLESACAQNALTSQLQEHSVSDLQEAVNRHCEVTREGTKLLNKIKTESGEKIAVACLNCEFYRPVNCVHGVCLHPQMRKQRVEIKFHCEYWKALVAAKT